MSDPKHGALVFFAETFNFDWSREYFVVMARQFERFDAVVVQAAVEKVCSETTERPWNALATLLAACDAEAARRTKRLVAPPKILPCIPGARFEEVVDYARSATEGFTHADLLRIRDEITEKRKAHKEAKDLAFAQNAHMKSIAKEVQS